MDYLLIGLGNIGAAYVATRHNVGFMVVDQLAQAQGVAFAPERLGAVANYRRRGRQLHLLKPDTYMNLSGKAVRYWLLQLQVPLERCLVIVDDLDLPFGQLRMRPQGGAAGHNGLKSIEECLGTQAYPRLRVGIGRNFARGHQTEYVLAPFTPQEQAGLLEVLVQAGGMAEAFCTLGIARAMEQFNATSGGAPR